GQTAHVEAVSLHGDAAALRRGGEGRGAGEPGGKNGEKDDGLPHGDVTDFRARSFLRRTIPRTIARTISAAPPPRATEQPESDRSGAPELSPGGALSASMPASAGSDTGSTIAMTPSTKSMSVSSRVSWLTPLHGTGPNEVTPMITSRPSSVMNAGPPESPLQVLWVASPRPMRSASKLSIATVVARRSPAPCCVIALVTP